MALQGIHHARAPGLRRSCQHERPHVRPRAGQDAKSRHRRERPYIYSELQHVLLRSQQPAEVRGPDRVCPDEPAADHG